MKRYRAGAVVPGGYYLNLASWEIAAVPGPAGALQAPEDELHLRIPVPLLLALVPMLGAAYAIYLPLAGFGMVAYAVGKQLGLVGRDAVKEAAATIGPTWRPGEAHFADGAKPVAAPTAQDRALDALEREIAERRASEARRRA
jgi:hypothetical protein